jgi:hypothetical protein
MPREEKAALLARRHFFSGRSPRMTARCGGLRQQPIPQLGSDVKLPWRGELQLNGIRTAYTEAREQAQGGF